MNTCGAHVPRWNLIHGLRDDLSSRMHNSCNGLQAGRQTSNQKGYRSELSATNGRSEKSGPGYKMDFDSWTAWLDSPGRIAGERDYRMLSVSEGESLVSIAQNVRASADKGSCQAGRLIVITDTFFRKSSIVSPT